MQNFTLNIPITKIDEERRLVYGTVTKEELDNSGECFDYDSSKPNFLAWNKKFSERTNGKSVGNLRSMHSNISAGIFKEMQYNDAEKSIEACAKVLDDNEWNKTIEGGYTGFSIGGKYAKRWTDSEGVTRYTGIPSEVSLVDSPCVNSATFTMVKSDGTEIEKNFKKGNPMKKDVMGAAEAINVAVQAEQIAVGEAINGEDTTAINAAVTALKEHVATELAEPEAHEDIAAALQDAAADEAAEDVVGDDDMMYADKTKGLEKGVIPTGQVACDKCNGKPGAMGTIGGAVCKKCMGKGYVPAPAEKMAKTEEFVVGELPESPKEVTVGAPISPVAPVVEAVAEPVEPATETPVETPAETPAENPEEVGKYDMPTDEQITKSLEKNGVEVNERTVGMAKDAYAGQILTKVLQEQQEVLNDDAVKSDLMKKINEVSELIKSNRKEINPFVYGTFTKTEKEITPAEALAKPDKPSEPIEVPTEPVTEPAEKIEKLEKSNIEKLDGVMAKVNDLVAKVESFESLKERLEKVEKTVVPMKVQTYAMDRFEKSEDTGKDLLNKIDEVSKKLKVDPMNPELQSEANKLGKQWMESRR